MKEKKERKKLPFLLIVYFMAIGFIFGLITYFPSNVVGDLTALLYESIGDERYYPDVDWQSCPRDIEIKGYHLDDTNVYTNYNGVLVKGVYINYAAGTGSMEPMVTKDTRILVERYNDQEINVGMVLIFKPAYSGYEDNQADRIIHRVVKIDSNQIITKGDNNSICESWTFDQIEYIVRGVLF